jgi:hypothetical protein
LYLRFPTSPSPSVLRHVHYTLITGRMTNNRSSRPRDNRSRSPSGPPPPASPLPPTRGATVSLPFSPLQPTAARLTRVRDPTVPLLPPFREAFPATAPLNDPDAGEDDSRPLPSTTRAHKIRIGTCPPLKRVLRWWRRLLPLRTRGHKISLQTERGVRRLLRLRPLPRRIRGHTTTNLLVVQREWGWDSCCGVQGAGSGRCGACGKLARRWRFVFLGLEGAGSASRWGWFRGWGCSILLREPRGRGGVSQIVSLSQVLRREQARESFPPPHSTHEACTRRRTGCFAASMRARLGWWWLAPRGSGRRRVSFFCPSSLVFLSLVLGGDGVVVGFDGIFNGADWFCDSVLQWSRGFVIECLIPGRRIRRRWSIRR